MTSSFVSSRVLARIVPTIFYINAAFKYYDFFINVLYARYKHYYYNISRHARRIGGDDKQCVRVLFLLLLLLFSQRPAAVCLFKHVFYLGSNLASSKSMISHKFRTATPYYRFRNTRKFTYI